MTEEKERTEKSKGVSRREFIAGTVGGVVVGAVVGAAAGSLGFPKTITKTQTTTQTATSTVTEQPWLPAKWDYSADVVVVGCGFAGISAAIAANAAGANVLVLEKAPTVDGGNSGCSVGVIHTDIRVDSVSDFISDIQKGVFGTVTDQSLITATANDFQATGPWLENLGAQLTWTKIAASVTAPSGYMAQITLSNGKAGQGKDLFAFLHNYATSKSITIMSSTPGTDLIQNPATNEVLGVKALTGVTATPGTGLGYSGGTPIYVKAAKGLVLAAGGYENNPLVQGWFNFAGVQFYNWGTPYNTGDGIRMSYAAGADQWHETCFEWANFSFKQASDSVHCAVSPDFTAPIPANLIYVNKAGKRFMTETNNAIHFKGHQPVVDFDPTTASYLNMPFYAVFDDTVMKAGPLAPSVSATYGTFTYNNVHGLYTWSTDNSAELSKGWIVQADTPSDLAPKMGIDPVGLAATVNNYNNYAAAGADPDFGRAAAQMKPINTPPYYAVEMCLAMVNTNGGPVHNANAQAVDTHGNPIPRLFTPGELGSINGLSYIAGNIAEALTFGRVAGQNAAALTSWT